MEETKRIFEDGEWKGEGNYPIEISEAERAFYENTAAQLATEHKVAKVHPVVMMDETTYKRAVAYIKEPNFDTKVYMMQQSSKFGTWVAAKEMAEICVIKEASDYLCTGTQPECDAYKLGVVRKCISIIDIQVDQFKKN